MPTQDIQTATGLASGGTLSASLDGLHEYDTVYVLVDDGAGGAPASYDLSYEASNTLGGSGSMTVSTETGSTARYHTYDAVPFDGTFTLTNQSGASADYRVRVIAVDEDV